MMCGHYLLRRRFIPYLEGGLEAESVRRVERHLMECEGCRDLFVRLRAGHQMAQRLERLLPGRNEVLEFGELATRLKSSTATWSSRWQGWTERLATPRAVTALAALVIVQLVLLVVSNRGVLLGERSRVSVNSGALNLSEFRLLSVNDLKSNTQPHVAADGYVYDVHTDAEEGTVAFRLVETPNGPSQFVVCEIITPMAAPRNGEHVRVYGVARYDAQSDRKWYEVNPVLNIAQLR